MAKADDHLNLNCVADNSVLVGEAITDGETSAGLRRLVPIFGGTIQGDRLRSIILPGCADYQIIRQDGYAHLECEQASLIASSAG